MPCCSLIVVHSASVLAGGRCDELIDRTSQGVLRFCRGTSRVPSSRASPSSQPKKSRSQHPLSADPVKYASEPHDCLATLHNVGHVIFSSGPVTSGPGPASPACLPPGNSGDNRYKFPGGKLDRFPAARPAFSPELPQHPSNMRAKRVSGNLKIPGRKVKAQTVTL